MPASHLARGAPRCPRPKRYALSLAVLVLGLSGCGRPEATSGAERVELLVFAASSLTEAFQELERGFEQAHPEVDVRLSFAGSQVLRLQISQGAKADVYASANPEHMAALVAEGLVGEPQTFATNELVIIVPPGNPAGLTRFEQLADAQRVVIGTAQVPAGIYARQVLARAAATLGDAFAASVKAHVVSEESNVRLTRAKVALGEADAALVYRTDAVAAPELPTVPIPPALNVRAEYPIGVLRHARAPSQAATFVAYMLSATGRQTLARHGFSAATP